MGVGVHGEGVRGVCGGAEPRTRLCLRVRLVGVVERGGGEDRLPRQLRTSAGAPRPPPPPLPAPPPREEGAPRRPRGELGALALRCAPSGLNQAAASAGGGGGGGGRLGSRAPPPAGRPPLGAGGGTPRASHELASSPSPRPKRGGRRGGGGRGRWHRRQGLQARSVRRVPSACGWT